MPRPCTCGSGLLGDDDMSAVTVFNGEATRGAAGPFLSSGWDGREIEGEDEVSATCLSAMPHLAHYGCRRVAWDDEEEAEEARGQRLVASTEAAEEGRRRRSSPSTSTLPVDGPRGRPLPALASRPPAPLPVAGPRPLPVRTA